MNEPFGIEVKFNVLHKTGHGINVQIMNTTADYLLNCARIILNDPENDFNYEALKCHDKLVRKAINIMKKAYLLKKEENEL